MALIVPGMPVDDDEPYEGNEYAPARCSTDGCAERAVAKFKGQCWVCFHLKASVEREITRENQNWPNA